MKIAGQYKKYKLNFEEQQKEIIASYIEDITEMRLKYWAKEITRTSFEDYRKVKYQEMVSALKPEISKDITIEAENKIEIPLKPSFNTNEIRLLYLMVLSTYLSVISLLFSEIVTAVFIILGVILSIWLLISLHRHAR